MRPNILLIGAIVSAAAVAQITLNGVIGVITAPAGVLNIIIGALTPKAPDVSTDQPGKLIVGRGAMKASIYQLVFLETKLVMKKLASVNTTVILALALFIGALVIEGSIISGLSGGLTGYSLQEFLTQRNRDRIRKRNTLAVAERGDLEFNYDDVDKVHLRGSSVQLFLQRGVIRVSLPRGYTARMREALERIIPDKLEAIPQTGGS